jgi:hypothetical protein
MEDPQVMRDRVQDAFTQASETYEGSDNLWNEKLR